MEPFTSIFQRAAERKGGEAALEALLPAVKTPRQLKRAADSFYLAEMTKCVFRSGFVWRIIENKWPGFTAAFHDFDVTRCAMLSDEELEALAQNEQIVRHAKKIHAVRNNARFVLEVRETQGSFGAYLAEWPQDNVAGLWDDLKSRGDRLGGQTGRYFLRFVGKDTPLFSNDVVQALIDQEVIDKTPTSKRALAQVQSAFNQWHAESDRPFSHISRILACSVGSTDQSIDQ